MINPDSAAQRRDVKARHGSAGWSGTKCASPVGTTPFSLRASLGSEVRCRPPDADARFHFRNIFRAIKNTFAGRSPNRRMKYGYHSVPNGT
jgi:hypothetical protein